MDTVDTHHAESHLCELLERVERGEEIVIAREGRPIARLTPWREVPRARVGGQWRGMVRVDDDFDAPLPREIDESFGIGSFTPG